jgi:2-keto-4-pentenoate hydratase/2-oxohepta-3-ene-1,7-dioic acid hydratase in catechol pathway
MKSVDLDGTSYRPSKVICVGRNFESHIAEMRGSAGPDRPAIFIKPNSAIACCPKEIFVPEELGLLHHEVELCCLMGDELAVMGYAVGLDLTLRDFQAEAKRAGMPWALAKGFDNSAVFGVFVAANEVSDPSRLNISLSVNGEIRQRSCTDGMIFSQGEILSYASRFMTIEPGDVLMCGTPEGVGPLEGGDTVIAEIGGLPKLEIAVKR